MASITDQYQKLYEQALEAQKNYNKTKNKKSSNNPNSLLGQKTTSVPTTKETPVKSNTEKKRVISNIKVAQPDYDFFNKQKSQTDTILEKGKKALADREKAFNEWYTEDKKDLIYNFDGSYRDLRTELETFKANSNILNMTPKELKAYTTYKNELETAIDHSDYLQQRDKEKTLSNLEEQKKFYLMQDAYNDTFGEKAAMKIGKVGTGILNMPFQVADVVNDFVNPNFNMSDPNNISNQLTSAMNEGEEQIQFNSSGAEQFALNTLEGVADFGAHFLMGMVTGVSPIVTMGAKSGLNKYAQNRQEGYDELTSLGNAVLSGTLTALTEKIGVDNFTNIITSPLGQFSIGALISQSLSEGAEEGIEYLAEPIIDFATLGKNVDYKAGELFMSVALGMSSGAVLGAMGNGVSAVKTRKAANQLKADMQVIQDYANKNDLSKQEAIAINEALALGNKTLTNFESKSVIGNAVTFESDKANVRSVEEIRENMYKFMQPQVDAETKTYKERMAVQNIIDNAQQTLANKGIRMDALQYSNLDEDIKKQVDTVQKLANDLKQDVIFNSELFTDNGEVIDGYYDNNTGRIVINPKGNNPALTTFVHEMTHGIESLKWYDSLKQLIIDSDSNFENGVKNIKEAYKIVTELDNEGATKEYVANKTQFMLGNEGFVERLVSYNNSLARRIYEGIKHISTNTSTLQNIEYNFMKAFKNNGLTEDGSFFGEKDLVTVDENSESAAPQFSLSTWTKTNKQRIVKDIVTKGIADEVTAQKWVDDVSGVAKQIANNKELLDYEANPYYSMKKKNSEYKYTIDVSTNCKKRLALAETIDAIQKELPNSVLTGEDYIRIRQMMAKDYEVSCGFCYVESRRKDLGKVAEMFIEQYNDPSLTIYDLVTDEGVTKLRANKPEVYKAFEKFNNKRGSGKVKLVESRTEYRGEIMRMQKGAINYLNKTGGLRLQSFSDFETPHLIDMMQVVLDMSRKGLTSQAYTKIPNFADAFGKTGIKINLSLVTYGINENGELVFDDKEGMPHKQAFALRKKYSDNVGTILVGKDDASILAAMKDDRIDFIIPYHRSGWAGKEYEALGITGYKDYTPYQKEYWIEPKTIIRRNGKEETETAPRKAIYPLDYWDFSKSGKENAETYLKLCAKQGKRPKFYNFLQDNGDGSWSLQPDGSTDGYWKTLIDFKMYNNDGVGAPQQPVMPIFDTEVNNRILAEYDGSHLGGNVKHDIVKKFLKEKKQGNKQFSIGLSADLQGSALTNEQTEYFKDSKARDEDGNLKVLYHGSTSAPFYEFDRNKAFIESDWGKGFYASDTYDDVANNYEGGGPDYENKVARLAEQIEAEEGIDYEEAEERAREQLGTDEYLIEAYGKFDNPAIVGETYVLNQEDYLDNYDIDDFEDEDEYYYAVEEIMSDTIDDAMQEVYNNLDFYNYDDYEKIKGVLYEVMSEGGTDILDLKERINNLYLETDEGSAGNEATRLILKGLGYDGIIDNSVSSRFNMGLDKNTTHYIAFDSSQYKNTDNYTPTASKDIRYSIGLSQQDIEGKTAQNPTKKENSAISNLKSKYSDLDPTLVDKALDEVKKNGFVTESTKGALKDDLMQFFGDASILEGNPKARNRVNDFITETVEQFATKGQYESDMKFVNSVASKASKLLNGYAGITEEDINNLYDEVSTIKKADALLKEGRDLAALNYTDVINDLLFKGKDAKGYMSQIERVLDKVGNGDPELRTKLREVLEFPRYQAQIQYVKCLKKYNETIDKIVKSGIREGSKESKAVQYMLEKHREDGSEYTNADLLKDFNYKMKNGKYAYENIEEAAKLLRKDYDDIFHTIDGIRTSIYGDVELKNDLDTKELQAKFEVAKTKVEKTKEALKKNPTEQTQKVYNAALNEYKLIARQLSTKLDEDASGDSTRRQKLEYRENYAHHTFKKESILMKSLRDRGGVKEVPTKLAGVSDFAQPKSGYASFFKKRTGGSYEADALKGFAEYIQDASRIIAYDPLIEYYRDFTSILRHSAQDDTMSQFTRYLTNYTNALAGKTNSLDRPVRELMGDTLFGAFKEINSRVKANAILGNLKTSVTQLANAPLAAGILVKNGGAGAVQDFTKGGFNYLTSLMGGKKDKSNASPFIQARYFDTDTDAMGIGAKVDDMFNFLLTKGDEVVTKMVWNAAYEQAVRKGVDSPIFYADDLTRRTVAGRSHGEVPVALQSQVMNFVIPFQVETTNIFNNIKDMVTDPKAWPSLLVVLLGNFFFDELYEKITGSRIQFDPIHTIRESIKNEEDIATASKHLLGETLSNVPGGNLIPTVVGMDSEETEEFFGDSDPTRYGTGNIGLSAIADAGTSLVNGKPLDAASDLLANFALPGGGKQIQRSVEALQANGILPQYVNGEWVISPTHYTRSGKEGYTTDPSAILDNASNLGNFAKQVAFGKWAGREAQEYLDGFGKGSTQKESKAQDIVNWFTSKDETVTEDDAVAISEEIKQAQENLTSSNPKGEFIEWMNNTEYTLDEKNMIFDTYYGDGKQVKNINNFATESNLSSKEAYQVKRALFTSEGKKAANKVDTIRNSKALEVRKKLDELGLYDEYVNYILENDLDLSSMGLNKKVVKMTNEEFESEYKGIFGSSYKAKTDEELLNTAYSQAIKSSGSSKKNTTSSSAKKLAGQKKKIDNIINAARTSSVGSNDNSFDEILSKLKNKTASSVTSSNSELLKKYLKEHAYDAALLG